MERDHIATATIVINAPAAKVWETLISPTIAKKYFFGAEVITSWQEGDPITFKGSFNGNQYEEKGILQAVIPNKRLQYTHWSHFDGLPDTLENYRLWTFDLVAMESSTQLTVSEDNIPTEKQCNRSNEFWAEVIATIKQLVEERFPG